MSRKYSNKLMRFYYDNTIKYELDQPDDNTVVVTWYSEYLSSTKSAQYKLEEVDHYVSQKVWFIFPNNKIVRILYEI